jgi:nucleotide-binding universal stress UspA family protein
MKYQGAVPAAVYDTILFPTDGSEGAGAALSHAVDLASRHDATLDVLFAAGDGTDVDPEAAVEEAAVVARDAGVDVNTVTIPGEPRAVIADYVQDRGVDAIVMATAARRGLERYIQGSVTEKVLRSVDVPVLVVPVGAAD